MLIINKICLNKLKLTKTTRKEEKEEKEEEERKREKKKSTDFRQNKKVKYCLYL